MRHKLKLLEAMTDKRDAGIKLNRKDRRLIAKLARKGLNLPPADVKVG